MIIVGIDPGNTHSAAVIVNDGVIVNHCYLPNAEFLEWCEIYRDCKDIDVVVEMIASYGMPVGREVFETCVFIGRLQALFGETMKRVTRIQVKSTICHSAKAKDSNIRQALIDIYGPVGTQKNPGGTFGLSGDKWAALAVATARKNNCQLYTP